VAVKGFSSPASALARIVDCLMPMCDGETTVHTGSAGSGETIDCCVSDCVLRVEEGSIFPRSGEMAMTQKCVQMSLDVSVIYRQCFKSNTKSGKARTAEELTTDGMDLVNSGWAALERLKCCTPYNQWIRFVSLSDNAPEGNCAGWTMSLSVDVVFCDPCQAGS